MPPQGGIFFSRTAQFFYLSFQNTIMKRTALTLSAAALIFLGSCGDNPSKDDGGDQVKEPVMNSGPNTEGERATEAVSDSSSAGSDSTVRKDKDAMSAPH